MYVRMPVCVCVYVCVCVRVIYIGPFAIGMLVGEGHLQLACWLERAYADVYHLRDYLGIMIRAARYTNM